MAQVDPAMASDPKFVVALTGLWQEAGDAESVVRVFESAD
jgi:hypothetical protein